MAELETDGYFTTTSFLNARLPYMRTTADLIAFDPHAVTADPAMDVVTLVERGGSQLMQQDGPIAGMVIAYCITASAMATDYKAGSITTAERISTLAV